MVAGVVQIMIALPPLTSLKEKRSVIRKIIARTRNRFPVSVAEVDELDSLTTGVIGVALVSNSRRYVNSLIDQIVEYVDRLGLARIDDHQFEILHY